MKNPIQYTLFVQRVSALVLAGSAFFLALCIFLLDPTTSLFIIGLFLVLLFALLVSGLNLLAFWWLFFIRKEIITVMQVNRIIGQSCISTVTIIAALVLQQTQQLNILSGGVLCGMYILYQLWAISE